MTQRVTIRSIAKEVGVSPMTVSESLRGVGRIGQSTRERVLSAAQSMGYRVNASAKAVKSGRFNTLALLVNLDHPRHRVLEQVWSGIHDGLRMHGQQLSVHRLSDSDLARDAGDPAIFREVMADGLLVNYGVAARVEHWLRSERPPAIWLNYKQSADAVRPDDRGAAEDATRHLLATGHRRVAYVDFVSDPNRPAHYSTRDRYEGYRDEMAKAGLTPRLIGGAGYLTPTQRARHADAILSQPDRPTAVVGYSAASIVPLVWVAATRHGLRLPKDLSVVCFHHTPLEDLGFAISTMVIPEVEMGRRAVDLLVGKIAGEARSEASSVVLPMRFAEGQTLGPPPHVAS